MTWYTNSACPEEPNHSSLLSLEHSCRLLDRLCGIGGSAGLLLSSVNMSLEQYLFRSRLLTSGHRMLGHGVLSGLEGVSWL